MMVLTVIMIDHSDDQNKLNKSSNKKFWSENIENYDMLFGGMLN